MHYVYVIYSEKLDRYYVGETHDVALRLSRHNEDYYEDKWSSRGKPWILYLSMSCENRQEAQALEAFIKRMKSRRFIESLKTDPEKRASIQSRFSQKES